MDRHESYILGGWSHLGQRFEFIPECKLHVEPHLSVRSAQASSKESVEPIEDPLLHISRQQLATP